MKKFNFAEAVINNDAKAIFDYFLTHNKDSKVASNINESIYAIETVTQRSLDIVNNPKSVCNFLYIIKIIEDYDINNPTLLLRNSANFVMYNNMLSNTRDRINNWFVALDLNIGDKESHIKNILDMCTDEPFAVNANDRYVEQLAKLKQYTNQYDQLIDDKIYSWYMRFITQARTMTESSLYNDQLKRIMNNYKRQILCYLKRDTNVNVARYINTLVNDVSFNDACQIIIDSRKCINEFNLERKSN